MSTVLIIPDAHAHPQDHHNDFARFRWLGEYIMDLMPDDIVCLGDFADMASLSSYDRGTKGFEGRRYKADIEACVKAQETLFAPLSAYNEDRREKKKARYSPNLHMVLGNHEDRIDRLTNAHAELDGHVGMSDLEFERFGWKVTPFKEKLNLHGVVYSHYFASGTSGRPVGGVNAARTLLNKNHFSSVAGHSHTYAHAVATRADGSPMFGLVAGCYTDANFVEGWNRDTVYQWRRGVAVLYGAGQGFYDRFEWVEQDYLRRRYS